MWHNIHRSIQLHKRNLDTITIKSCPANSNFPANSDVFGSFSHSTACIKHLCIIKNINIIFSYLLNNPYKIASIGLPDELHVFSEKLSHPCVSQGSLHPRQLHPCNSASFFKFGFKCKGFPILDPTQPYLPSNSIIQLRFYSHCSRALQRRSV